MSTGDLLADDGSDYGPRIIAISAVFTGIATLAFGLRVYVRAVLLKAFGTDDWTLVIAQLANVGVFVSLVGCFLRGQGETGYYDWDLDKWIDISEWKFYFLIFAPIAIAMLKISIGFLLLRFAQTPRLRWCLYISIGFVLVFMVEWVLVNIFGCWPVQSAWNFRIDGKCYSAKASTVVTISNSVVVLLTDLLFTLLPIPVIWKLNYNRKTKLILYGCVGLALLATCASILKLTFTIISWQRALDVLDGGKEDRIAYFLGILFWVLEINLGIIATSVPVLRPLYAKVQARKVQHHGIVQPIAPVQQAQAAPNAEVANGFPARTAAMRNWFSIASSSHSATSHARSATRSGARSATKSHHSLGGVPNTGHPHGVNDEKDTITGAETDIEKQAGEPSQIAEVNGDLLGFSSIESEDPSRSQSTTSNMPLLIHEIVPKK